MSARAVRAAPLGTTTAVAGTVALAAACWVVALRRMSGMDMGAATDLGSFEFFIGLWVPMMAAMMLPAAVPAVSAFIRSKRRPLAAPLFVGSYLAVWALFGGAVYGLYQEHNYPAAGALTIAAGLYELTPMKRGCRQSVRSGFEFGFLVALGIIGLGILVAVTPSSVPGLVVPM